MEPTDEWWQRQLLKRVRKQQRLDAEITASMIREYEDRHRNDGQVAFEKDPVEPDPVYGSEYDGYIG